MISKNEISKLAQEQKTFQFTALAKFLRKKLEH